MKTMLRSGMQTCATLVRRIRNLLLYSAETVRRAGATRHIRPRGDKTSRCDRLPALSVSGRYGSAGAAGAILYPW